MALPANVKKQVDAANKLLAERQGKPESEQDQPASPPNPEPEPPREPEPTPSEPEPKPDAEPTPQEPDPSEPADRTNDASYWRQRFVVMQGKYNAEVPALHAEIRDIKAQLEHAGSAPAMPDSDDLLTDEEREEYGDMLPLIRREAERIAQRIVADQVSPVRESLAQNERQAQESAGTKYNVALYEAVPDWETVNANPEFHAWLAEIDPYSGKERDALLKEAHAALDAPRVIRFFKDFKAIKAAAKPDPQPRQVLPDTTRGAGEAPPQARIWSSADIRKFYADRAAGRYRGRETEAAALEQDIFAAQREGRIQ